MHFTAEGSLLGETESETMAQAWWHLMLAATWCESSTILFPLGYCVFITSPGGQWVHFWKRIRVAEKVQCCFASRIASSSGVQPQWHWSGWHLCPFQTQRGSSLCFVHHLTWCALFFFSTKSFNLAWVLTKIHHFLSKWREQVWKLSQMPPGTLKDEGNV